MEKTTNKIIAAAALAVVLVSLVAIGVNTTCAESQAEITPAGVYTRIEWEIEGDGQGNITGTAKNAFTLGTSVIPVYVALFRSDDYVDNTANMVLVAQRYTADLNIFEAISVTASTGGRSSYWAVRVRYNKDYSGWTEIWSPIFHFDAQGNII